MSMQTSADSEKKSQMRIELIYSMSVTTSLV